MTIVISSSFYDSKAKASIKAINYSLIKFVNLFINLQLIMKGIVLIFIVLFVKCIFGQVPFNGTCPSFEECRDLDLCFTADQV